MPCREMASMVLELGLALVLLLFGLRRENHLENYS